MTKPEIKDQILNQLKEFGIEVTIPEIQNVLKVAHMTIYRYLVELEIENKVNKYIDSVNIILYKTGKYTIIIACSEVHAP